MVMLQAPLLRLMLLMLSVLLALLLLPLLLLPRLRLLMHQLRSEEETSTLQALPLLLLTWHLRRHHQQPQQH